MLSLLICQMIFVFSFLGMLFIFLRNYPKMILSQPGKLPLPKKRERLEKMKLNLQYFFTTSGEKTFHQFRIFTLKIDNKINSWLENLRKKRFYLFLKKRRQAPPKKDEKSQGNQKLS